LDITKDLPELLCPAGDMERLLTAFVYGADAAYLGGPHLNLRSRAKGFSPADLDRAIIMARNHNARIYYCLNALPLQNDTALVRDQLEKLSGLDIQGLIVADPGVLSLARKLAPRLPLHLSTQANTCNAFSVNFWKDQGVKRVNLSRELDLKGIKAISSEVKDIELEIFVHGAMCMAISGRCFLSAHLNARSANQGHCAHPCRYEYRPFIVDLEERTRPGYPVWQLEQGENYSRIFSAQDLCLVKYIPWFARNIIHSLKIEGRTKSAAYLAIVTDVYRTALDDFARKNFRPVKYLEELALICTRAMSTGFFLKKRTLLAGQQKAALRNKKILARVLEKIEGGKWLVQIKEKWPASIDIELVLPGLIRPVIPAAGYCLENESGQKTDAAHSGMTAVFCCDHDQLQENIFIRKNN
jgi:U32 family peptidase